jgi:hypothetical protein
MHFTYYYLLMLNMFSWVPFLLAVLQVLVGLLR